MENPKKNTGNQNLGKAFGQDNSERNDLRKDNSGRDNLDTGRFDASDDKYSEEDTDKYLALEQEGVTFTQETDPTLNSDHMDFGSESRKNQWNNEGGNSRNSEAFNQDDYLLNDNLDLDEDQNQSLSSDDEDFEETNERY